MLIRRACPLLFLFSTPLVAQEKKEPKWDIEAAHGPADTISFTTDEGTWMSVDVSPDDQWIAFDLLGDIYRMPIAGGTGQLLSGGQSWEHQPRWSPDGKTIVFTSDRSGIDNLWLMDADGSNRRQLTKLTESFPTNPTWLPDGEYIVAKRHVKKTRSLGGGEIWLFHREGGSGVRLSEKQSFTSEQNEPYPSRDGRWIYYDYTGPFDYNRDPNGSIFQVNRFDRRTGRIEPVTDHPGGAVRPTPSPDGKSLAFIRRVGVKSVLFVRDLAGGADRKVFDGLDHDQQEAWTVHGVYPGFSWTPDSKRIVITYGGKLWSIDVASGQSSAIPFTAQVTQVVAQALHFDHPIRDDSIRARMIRWPVLSPDGKLLVFQALGSLWRMSYPNGRPERVLPDSALQYAPRFSPDGGTLTYTTWSEDQGGHVWTLSLTRRGARPVRLTGTADQYANPVFSPDGKYVAFVEGNGVVNRGDDLGGEGFLNIRYVPAVGGEAVHVVTTANRGANRRMPRIRWSSDGRRLLYSESAGDTTFLTSIALDGTDRRRLAENARAEEMVPSPDGRWVAFKELHNVYVAPLPLAGGSPVKIEAEGSGVPVKQLSKYDGDWLDWRPDGSGVTWVLGPAFYHQTVADAFAKPDSAAAAAADSVDEGWMKENAKVPATITEIVLTVAKPVPQGTVILRGARVVTMKGDEVLEHADVVVRGDRIVAVIPEGSAPAGDRVVDVRGKTIIPGLVDVHAHMGYGSLDITPERYWPYYANLAYGVTSTHDPSASTQVVFAQSEMVESGRMLGPRVFSTGFILYGAENPNQATITNLEDARGHLRRLKAVGAFSVKSYNQLRRDVRQWVIQAARDEQMLVVPEGGSMYQQNMTMILDGHTGIEHAIPVAPLHQDALTLFSRSRTGYTPTLIVAYGGPSGENYWYQHSDVFANQRLRTFVPGAGLDARSRRRVMIPDEEYWHVTVSKSAKALIDAGGQVQLGAHGQLQGLGAHWELWMFAQGGMTPLEALRSATLSGARYLGLDHDLGSIEAGKLADLVILDGNPLADIRQSERVNMVMKNGVLYDADLNEVWPVARKVAPLRAGALGVEGSWTRENEDQ